MRHIALWNENVTFADVNETFERPAVFVEFGVMEWVCGTLDSHLDVVFTGVSVLRIHVATDYLEGGDEGGFALVRDTLIGLKGERRGPLLLVRTMTNHNHEELLKSIEEFSMRVWYMKAS